MSISKIIFYFMNIFMEIPAKDWALRIRPDGQD